MPTYSVANNNTTCVYRGANGGLQAGLIAYRIGLVSNSTAARTIVFAHSETSAATSVTPQKFNSRSSAPSAQYFQSNVGGSGGNIAVFGLAAFNNSSYIAQPRSTPIALNGDAGTVFVCDNVGGGGTLTGQFSVDEDVYSRSWSRGTLNRRRTRKPGYFNMLGNTVHRAGGVQIHPSFQNDITWVDPSAWRNGATVNPWNMNLQGTTPRAPQRMFMGVGQ